MVNSEDNKKVVVRWYDEVWNHRRDEAIDAMLAEDHLAHGLGGEAMRGRAAFRAFHRAVTSALPNLFVTVEDAVAEGDRVAVRCTAAGTHRATGKKVRFACGGICTVKEGRITESHDVWDFAAMLTQIGVLDPGTLEAAISP